MASSTGTSNLADLPWPSGFPSAQQQALETLSSEGQLSGIPPQLVAYIEQAESPSGWIGYAGYNSAGYGGYFGLSAADLSDNGQPTSAIQATGTGASAGYEQQAIAAAAIFAKMLQANGDNAIVAENAYQTGSDGNESITTEGGAIFFGYLKDVGEEITPGVSTTTNSGGDAGAATPGLNIDANVLGDLGTLIGDVLSGSFWKRIGIFTLGAGLVVVGIYLFAKNSDTVTTASGSVGNVAGLAALAE